jgi:two-component system, chemotaxis family, chemotaxis protein CheY
MSEHMRGLAALSVLVVDDHQQMRRLIASLLRGFGFCAIVEARDSEEAWKRLQAAEFDIVLLDTGTRSRGAIDLIKQIRRDPKSRRPDVAIIWMSAFTERQRVLDARDAGISEVLVKPLTARALLDRIFAVIDRPRPFIRASCYLGPDRRRISKPLSHSRCRRQGNAISTGAR